MTYSKRPMRRSSKRPMRRSSKRPMRRSSKRPMRRSSLISPWGVGAIVPFPNDESLMIAGLDKWRYSDNDNNVFLIADERLQKRLGVKELRWPPDYRDINADPKNYHLTIPTVRFPTWLYCPFCGSMKKVTYFSHETPPECDCYPWPNGRRCNPNARFKRRLLPERFIVVCPEGHIDDFPVAEWLHSDNEHSYNPNSCKIRRSTGGASAALTGVIYECTCGAKKSMAGATLPKALEKIGYHCKGAQPWLGRNNTYNCNSEEVKVLLRGATNVWFADTRSSIHIPIDDELSTGRLKAILDEYFPLVNSMRINGELDRTFINRIADTKSIDGDALFNAFVARERNENGISDVSEEITEDAYRLAEYRVLIKSSGSDVMDFHSINYPIENYNIRIHKYFKSISLVPKLRETRAFVGFSRLKPNDMPISERKKMLRIGNENWLPAIEVYGEGIFFEFNHEALEQWAQEHDVFCRVEKLNDSYKASKFGQNSNGGLRPEFVLIHSFAHLIINQLSFECGYGSSSIRERIYCEKTSNDYDMYGVLIYTASGDSEGSLGGLVRQGKPGRIEDMIIDAIQNALWCTSDPICIQSCGQGPESCNMAACHNCALLPETCCETGNRLLDRGVIVGTLDNTNIGFFKELVNLKE